MRSWPHLRRYCSICTEGQRKATHNVSHDILRPDLNSTGHLTNTSEKPCDWSQVSGSRTAKNNFCFYISRQYIAINCTVLQSSEGNLQSDTGVGYHVTSLGPAQPFPSNFSCCDLWQVKWVTETCLCQTLFTCKLSHLYVPVPCR
jgi:hypothetical protein